MFDIQVPDLHVTVEVKGLEFRSATGCCNTPGIYASHERHGGNEWSMGSFYANMPDEVTLTVNGNHPIYQSILKQDGQEKQTKLVRNLADLALLSQGLLKGNDLTTFINRSVELMGGDKKARSLSKHKGLL